MSPHNGEDFLRLFDSKQAFFLENGAESLKTREPGSGPFLGFGYLAAASLE